MDVDEDCELMLKYARGDVRAFETLYMRHRGALYRYLARHTRNPDTANDLFQEVWGKLIATRERYEPRARFQTFLYRIAHNCFVDHCRRSAVRQTGDAQVDLEAELVAPDRDEPDARANALQVMRRYRKALADLPPEQRDVFLLYEESGLSLAEIAAISDVGAETAKSRLRYALAKLRSALADTQELQATPASLEEPGL